MLSASQHDQAYGSIASGSKSKSSNKKCFIMSITITLIIALGIIGYYAMNSYYYQNSNLNNSIMDKKLLISQNEKDNFDNQRPLSNNYQKVAASYDSVKDIKEQGLDLAGPHHEEIINDNTKKLNNNNNIKKVDIMSMPRKYARIKNQNNIETKKSTEKTIHPMKNNNVDLKKEKIFQFSEKKLRNNDRQSPMGEQSFMGGQSPMGEQSSIRQQSSMRQQSFTDRKNIRHQAMDEKVYRPQGTHQKWTKKNRDNKLSGKRINTYNDDDTDTTDITLESPPHQDELELAGPNVHNRQSISSSIHKKIIKK